MNNHRVCVNVNILIKSAFLLLEGAQVAGRRLELRALFLKYIDHEIYGHKVHAFGCVNCILSFALLYNTEFM